MDLTNIAKASILLEDDRQSDKNKWVQESGGCRRRLSAAPPAVFAVRRCSACLATAVEGRAARLQCPVQGSNAAAVAGRCDRIAREFCTTSLPAWILEPDDQIVSFEKTD